MQNSESNKSNKRKQVKMNIPLRGLSSSAKSHQKRSISSKSIPFDTKNKSSVAISKSKSEKLLCHKAFQRFKYERRSKKYGNAFGGLKKNILRKMYRQSLQYKLPLL